ncbi:MAG: methylmalonyl-CoA mutase family protein [Selenomonas sp.]|jgi:methylmalonyl-CoA mutase N-terminal domain/subunit|nr:methylmalonyl-CoA mutase family protein [Selenomonas sp.]
MVQRGLSCAFDLPTQIGYDSTDAISEGEVGKVGVAIDSLADMEVLFDKIDLGKGFHVHDDQCSGIRPAGYVYRCC